MDQLTEAQRNLFPDLIKLQKLAHEMGVNIEAISTTRLRNNILEVDYEMIMLGIECFSSDLLYKVKNNNDQKN